MASDGKIVPEDANDLSQFYHALVAKGDNAFIIAEFSEITNLQTANGCAFYYLGLAHQRAEDFSSARNAFLAAVDLKFSDRWLPYNLATEYWYLEDYSSAATWYREG